MKKAILFYSKSYDPEVERHLSGLEKYLGENKISFKIVNIYEDPMLAEEYKILTSPALVLIVNNKETNRYIGTPEDILNHLKKVKGGEDR